MTVPVDPIESKTKVPAVIVVVPVYVLLFVSIKVPAPCFCNEEMLLTIPLIVPDPEPGLTINAPLIEMAPLPLTFPVAFKVRFKVPEGFEIPAFKIIFPSAVKVSVGELDPDDLLMDELTVILPVVPEAPPCVHVFKPQEEVDYEVEIVTLVPAFKAVLI